MNSLIKIVEFWMICWSLQCWTFLIPIQLDKPTVVMSINQG